jgi:hypothetical protein
VLDPILAIFNRLHAKIYFINVNRLIQIISQKKVLELIFKYLLIVKKNDFYGKNIKFYSAAINGVLCEKP